MRWTNRTLDPTLTLTLTLTLTVTLTLTLTMSTAWRGTQRSPSAKSGSAYWWGKHVTTGAPAAACAAEARQK